MHIYLVRWLRLVILNLGLLTSLHAVELNLGCRSVQISKTMGSINKTPVAIIGGGLAVCTLRNLDQRRLADETQGLSLAIALHAQAIPCKIYELRSQDFSHGGAVMLSPNALQILDSLGVYERVQNRGYSFETIAFKDENQETTGLYSFGHRKLYGYKALRIYRQVLISEMRLMINDLGIPIEFDKKFSHVVSESEDGVSFAFGNGSTEHTSLLIGADGIHSKVRHCVSPNTAPIYSGQLAMTYTLQRSQLRFPPGIPYSLPVGISSSQNGMFILAPQSVDGEELLAGTQRAYPETNRTGWDKLYSSKERLLELIRTDVEDWPDIVRSALENIALDTLTIWPFYTLTRLPSWSSPSGKVLVLGDAAHAIPPTAGQGVNQAFEDIFMLSLLLSNRLPSGISLSEKLEFLQEKRQERVDAVLDLTKKMNNRRLPKEEREEMENGEVWEERNEVGGAEEMRWLYAPKIEEVVEKWVASQEGKSEKQV